MYRAPGQRGYFDQDPADLDLPVFPPENLNVGKSLGSSSLFSPPLASGPYYRPSSPTNWSPVPHHPLPPSSREGVGFYPQTRGVPCLDSLVDIIGADHEAGAGAHQDLGVAEYPYDPDDPEKQAAINSILAYLLDDQPALCCVQNPTKEHAMYYWIPSLADDKEHAMPDYGGSEQQSPSTTEMSPPVSFTEQIRHEFLNKPKIWKKNPKRTEIIRFIKFYSRKRWSFGHTQADVGVIMTSMSGKHVSKAIISRFENKKLCFDSMCEVKSMLESYIEASEKYPDILERVCKEEHMLGMKKLRLSAWQKAGLEKHYTYVQDRPDAQQLFEISKHLHLPRMTTAMWFRNRRKKTRNAMARFDRALRTRSATRSMMQSVSPHVPTLHNLPYSSVTSIMRSRSDAAALPGTSMSHQPQL